MHFLTHLSPTLSSFLFVLLLAHLLPDVNSGQITEFSVSDVSGGRDTSSTKDNDENATLDDEKHESNDEQHKMGWENEEYIFQGRPFMDTIRLRIKDFEWSVPILMRPSNSPDTPRRLTPSIKHLSSSKGSSPSRASLHVLDLHVDIVMRYGSVVVHVDVADSQVSALTPRKKRQTGRPRYPRAITSSLSPSQGYVASPQTAAPSQTSPLIHPLLPPPATMGGTSGGRRLDKKRNSTSSSAGSAFSGLDGDDAPALWNDVSLSGHEAARRCRGTPFASNSMRVSMPSFGVYLFDDMHASPSHILSVYSDNIETSVVHHFCSPVLPSEPASKRRTLSLSVGCLQVDNQTDECEFPVVVASVPDYRGEGPKPISLQVEWRLPSTLLSTSDAHDALSLSVFQDQDLTRIALWVHPLQINVEDRFMLRFNTFLKRSMARLRSSKKSGLNAPTAISGVGPDTHFPSDLEVEPPHTPLSPLCQTGMDAKFLKLISKVTHKRVFIQSLRVSEIRFIVTISSTTSAIFVGARHMPVTLDGIELNAVLASVDRLATELAANYTACAIVRSPMLLGSLDILGNPTVMLQGFSHGISDLVGMPSRAVGEGPVAVVKATGRGLVSFFRHASEGALISLSAVSGSLARNIERMSSDDVFSQRRQTNRSRDPRSISGGLVQGAATFSQSVAGGLSNIVSAPMQGATKDGTWGFFRGIGTGMIGAVTKPVSGVFDLLSQTSKGIASATRVPEHETHDRRAVNVERRLNSDGNSKTFSRMKFEAIAALIGEDYEAHSCCFESLEIVDSVNRKDPAVSLHQRRDDGDSSADSKPSTSSGWGFASLFGSRKSVSPSADLTQRDPSKNHVPVDSVRHGHRGHILEISAVVVTSKGVRFFSSDKMLYAIMWADSRQFKLHVSTECLSFHFIGHTVKAYRKHSVKGDSSRDRVDAYCIQRIFHKHDDLCRRLP